VTDFNVNETLKKLSDIDKDITQWVKALPVVNLANYKRIRDKRQGIVETVQKMGYKAR
jgi:hypothetical protein